MSFAVRQLALAGAFFLASCGGGGGSAGGGTGGVGSGGPQSVAISAANAKPVAAHAMDATQDSAATSGATLPTAVQLDTAPAPTTLQVIAQAARLAAQAFSGAKLPAAVAVSQNVACTLGGTMAISGNIASVNGLGAGDTLSVSTTNCVESIGGQTVTLNGQLSITIASGSMTDTLPFHLVMNVTATNLSTQAGGVTTVASGDVRLDWTENTATAQTLSASGSVMTSRVTTAGVTRTNTVRNYSQTLTINGTARSGSLSAAVETDSSRLGSTPVSYSVSTPAPLLWSAATRQPTAGAIKVVGANGSQLLATFNADGSVNIQVDANGDGAFEATVASTAAELSGLR